MNDERVVEVPIELIKRLDNSRIRIEDEDLASLMDDIKHRGLLQPIGLLMEGNEYIIRFGNRRLEACKKLGWKTIPAIISNTKLNIDSFMSDNVAENTHRLELSPLELAKVVMQYKEKGYSISEICSLFTLSRNKIESCLRVMSYAPEDFKKNIDNIKNSRDKSGKISVNVANEIVRGKYVKNDKVLLNNLFKFAKSEELSGDQIRLIKSLINEGMPFDIVKVKYKDYLCTTAELVFLKSEYEKYKSNTKELMKAFISGEIKSNKKILYNNSKNKITTIKEVSNENAKVK